MNSNYMFAINRRQMGTGPAAGTSPAARSLAPAPRSLAPAPRSLAPAPRSLAPAPRSLAPAPSPAPSGDRFSINRLINYKSAGGCRSCN